MLVKENIPVPKMTAASAAANNANKKVRFENCASFSHCISEINNTQVDDAKYIDAAMALYNLMEYSDIYSKTFESLWQYYIDETAWNNCRDTICFVSNINNSVLFKLKTGNDGTKDVETIVPLKDLSKILRTTEMLLIKFEIDFILTWYVNFLQQLVVLWQIKYQHLQ